MLYLQQRLLTVAQQSMQVRSLFQNGLGTQGILKGQILQRCINKIHHLYHQGKECKSLKVSSDRAHKTLVADIILHYWYAQCIVTVSKIKDFFSLMPVKMTELMDDGSGTAESM